MNGTAGSGSHLPEQSGIQIRQFARTAVSTRKCVYFIHVHNVVTNDSVGWLVIHFFNIFCLIQNLLCICGGFQVAALKWDEYVLWHFWCMGGN